MTSTMKHTARAGLAATFAALALAATACGTETAAEPAKAAPAAQAKPAPQAQHAPMSADATERMARDLAEQKARAERADAKRWAQGNETRRH